MPHLFSSLDLSAHPCNNQFADHPNLDANLNYIKQFLSQNLGVNNLGGTGYHGILVNPQEWFIAAYAYLQLAGENPMYFRKVHPASDLAPIIGHGQNDRQFLQQPHVDPGHHEYQLEPLERFGERLHCRPE